MKALLDFIPLVLFFYFSKTGGKDGIFLGTQALLVSMVAIYAFHFVQQKWRLEKSQWLTLLATVGFCGLTLLLHDDVWLRWKSTAINWIFALVMVAGNLVGDRPIPERVLGSVFDMPRRKWQKLAMLWALYFLVLGGAHWLFAFVWPAHWLDFKVWGSMAITLVFMVANVVGLKAHLRQDLPRP